MSKLLDGRDLASSIDAVVGRTVEELKGVGVEPKLVVVLATRDESAHWYARSISRRGAKVGIVVEVQEMSADSSLDAIETRLSELRDSADAQSIVLGTPLPGGVDLAVVAGAIPPSYDVDGANPLSAGRVACDLEAFSPTTAEAVIRLLKWHDIPLRGSRAVVIGRSLVVGRPLLQLLLREDATVTVAHSRTNNLEEVTRQAEILICAAGRPGLVTREHVQDGTVVVDVGTTPDEEGNLVGDVCFEEVSPHVAAISPVPGGVGPVTTSLLLRNAAVAASSVRLR